MVRIVQCLCPSRHCILAFAYEPGSTAVKRMGPEPGEIILDDTNAAQYLRSIIEQSVAKRQMNPWCGICQQRDLFYEDRISIFKTLAEAYPMLKKAEEDQRQTREFLDSQRN
jgi:hypothetical protein